MRKKQTGVQADPGGLPVLELMPGRSAARDK
jgi:hypothetical protein